MAKTAKGATKKAAPKKRDKFIVVVDGTDYIYDEYPTEAAAIKGTKIFIQEDEDRGECSRVYNIFKRVAQVSPVKRPVEITVSSF